MCAFPIVELEGVKLTYHDRQAETLAVKDMSFKIDSGEFVSIVGPSGCGKTSILSLLAGLMEPSAGRIRILGNKPDGTDARVGYMLQRDHLLDWRSIEENVLLGLEVKRIKDADVRERALRLLDTYGLSDFRKSYPRQLSGGMRQKVALIRTLAFEPELLLLDEPFSALDYQTRLRVADEVREIIDREKKTALLVTHDISEAISMSGRVLMFSERPATLKREVVISFDERSPLKRRNIPVFKNYFDLIWKELDKDGQ